MGLSSPVSLVGRWKGLRTRPTTASSGRVVGVLSWVLVVTALAVPLVVWFDHLRDAFRWDHTSGVWLALGAWADHGVVMPPLHEESYFAGTRYMPIPIALLGAMTAATGAPVVAGRAFTLLGTVLLSVVLYRYARLLGASALATLSALVLMVSAPAATQTITLVRNDTTSVAFGLAALMTVHRQPGSRTRWAMAGLLAAMAATWKISELWPVAALVCLGCVSSGSPRARLTGRLAPLGVGFGGTVVITTVVSFVLSGGRFFEVLGATLLGHEDSVLDLKSWVPRLIDQGIVQELGLLLPVVLLGWVCSVLDWRKSGPLAFATVFAMLVTAEVYVDRGAASNHLIAVVALGLLGALRMGATLSLRYRQRVIVSVTTTVLALISCWTTWDGALYSAAINQHPAFYTARTTAAGPVLTEDPAVSVLAGELPVVSDPFAFRRLALVHPAWSEELDARIAAGGFSQIVLLTEPVESDPDWYVNKHFGRSTIASICRDYHSTGIVGDGRYETFAPGAGPIPSTSVCARASY